MRKAISLALVLAGTLALSACTSPALESAGGSTPFEVGEKPDFSGPFSAELNAAWDESDSDFVRAVVTDGVVSDQEWAELGTRMATCLDGYGITFEGFDDQGSYNGSGNTLDQEELSDALAGCEASTGEAWLTGLRRSMADNPKNIPVEEVMTQCLVRNGAVAPDYTKEQFLQDNPNLSFPFMGTQEEEIFWSCNDDPSYDAR